MKINSRLKMIGDLAPANSFCLDVGCDHALLSIFISQNKNPKKVDDHALDELRYYLMTKPENLPPKVQKTQIQKDKERLFRRIMNERKK